MLADLYIHLLGTTSMPMTRNKPTAASLRHEFLGCVGQKAHRTTMVHSAEWLRTKEDRVLSPEWSMCVFFLYLYLFVLHFCLNISSLEAALVIKGWCFRSKWCSIGRFCHYSRPKRGMTFCSSGNITHIHVLLSKLSTFTTRTLTLVLSWPFDSWACCIWDWVGGLHTGINISTSLICVLEWWW